MKKYFPLLDGARFFAAFWVMNFHYLFVWGTTSNMSWYRYGNLGVQLFFIISGFVIIQSIQGKSLKSFAISRFIRLFPLFWILCTVTYLSTIFIPHTTVLYFKEYLTSMAMLGDVINTIAHTHYRLIDPSYWTLAVELTFYCALAVFVAIFSYKNIRYFLLSWLLLSILTFAFNIDEYLYTKLLLVQHASYFIFGGSLFLIISKQAGNIYEKYLDYVLLFLSVIFSLYISPRVIPFYINRLPSESYMIKGVLIIIFISTSLLVYCSHYSKGEKVIKVLSILGGISYPLYLLHQTTGNAIINYCTKKFNLSWNASVVCFEICIIIITWGIYHLDKKFRTWIISKITM